MDALAPTNFLATNPEVLNRALSTEGASLAQGLANLAADAQRGRISMSDERAFEVGRNLAVTPGSVVFRNELIELLQYTPTTARVRRRPLVIVPPCINKYYILDLQPENSFVRWAVGEGHTVFMVSWRNIPAELGSLTWDDYLEQGVLTAIGIAREIADSKTVNALGFCVGGTLLACALAVAAARGDRSVASLTLLTTMLDFADPGDIGVYVSRDFLAAREPALMAGQRIRRQRARGRVREPPRQRPRVELRRQQLPQGRNAACVRPPALERRFAEPAGADVRRRTSGTSISTTSCAKAAR